MRRRFVCIIPACACHRDMDKEAEELREKLQDTCFDSLYPHAGCLVFMKEPKLTEVQRIVQLQYQSLMGTQTIDKPRISMPISQHPRLALVLHPMQPQSAHSPLRAFPRSRQRVHKSRHLETYRKLMPQMTAGRLYKHKYRQRKLGFDLFTILVIADLVLYDGILLGLCQLIYGIGKLKPCGVGDSSVQVCETGHESVDD